MWPLLRKAIVQTNFMAYGVVVVFPMIWLLYNSF